MIRVNVETRDSLICSLEVSGHAEFLDSGRDIVCAAASLVGTGLLNALDELEPDTCELLKESNRIYISVLSGNERIQTILTTGLIQYQTLAEQFPRYVKVKKTEVRK